MRLIGAFTRPFHHSDSEPFLHGIACGDTFTLKDEETDQVCSGCEVLAWQVIDQNLTVFIGYPDENEKDERADLEHRRFNLGFGCSETEED